MLPSSSWLLVSVVEGGVGGREDIVWCASAVVVYGVFMGVFMK